MRVRLEPFGLFHPLECLSEGRSLCCVQNLLGHRKEHMIFFDDVLGQQLDVPTGWLKKPLTGCRISRRAGFDRTIHLSHETAPHLVLVEHQADRSPFAGHAVFSQSRQEQLLFLPVVATVGELSNEGDHLRQGIGSDRLAPLDFPAKSFDDPQDLSDDPMVMSEEQVSA